MRILLGLMMVSLFSCKAPEDGGEIQLTVASTDLILIDAKAQSCKSRISSTPTDDVNSLYADLGKFSITWDPPKDANGVLIPGTTLKIIYIKIYPRSAGLASGDPKTIAGQDLNCLMTSNIDGDSSIDSSQPTFSFLQGHIFGDLGTVDPNKRARFSGRADVLIYGILRIPGKPETPMQGRSSFNFQFDGVF